MNAAVRATLAIVIALLLTGGVVSAFTVDDAGDSDKVAAGGDDPVVDGDDDADATTTTAAGDSGGDDSGAATTIAGGASGGGTDTSVVGGGGSGSSNTPPAPGPMKPPSVGTYEYEVTTDGEKETERRAVSKAAGAGNNDFDVHDQGNGTTDRYSWRNDGVFLLTTKFEGPSGSGTCDWTPDAKVFAIPLAAGTSWSIDSRCTVTSSGVTVNLHLTGNYKVVRAERVKVGGESVDVWVIEYTSRVDITSPNAPAFNGHREESGARHFAPAHGLMSYSRSKETVNEGDRTRTSEQERVLKSLKPS